MLPRHGGTAGVPERGSSYACWSLTWLALVARRGGMNLPHRCISRGKKMLV